MKRNRLVQMIGTLAVIAVFSAILLALTAQITTPIIERHRQEALQQAILQVLPGAKSYEAIDEQRKIYRGLDGDGREIGYAFVATGGGYQGPIRVMVGVFRDWRRLTGIKILENIETPGLGAKIAGNDFQKQFQGVEIIPEIESVRSQPPLKRNQIQAITGATISSRAVVKILNQSIAKRKPDFQNKGN